MFTVRKFSNDWLLVYCNFLTERSQRTQRWPIARKPSYFYQTEYAKTISSLEVFFATGDII